MNYPKQRPQTMADVRRGHIVGKVTLVSKENSLWLRDALDISLAKIAEVGEYFEQAKRDRDHYDALAKKYRKALEEIAATEHNCMSPPERYYVNKAKEALND